MAVLSATRACRCRRVPLAQCPPGSRGAVAWPWRGRRTAVARPPERACSAKIELRGWCASSCAGGAPQARVAQLTRCGAAPANQPRGWRAAARVARVVAWPPERACPARNRAARVVRRNAGGTAHAVRRSTRESAARVAHARAGGSRSRRGRERSCPRGGVARRNARGTLPKLIETRRSSCAGRTPLRGWHNSRAAAHFPRISRESAVSDRLEGRAGANAPVAGTDSARWRCPNE